MSLPSYSIWSRRRQRDAFRAVLTAVVFAVASTGVAKPTNWHVSVQALMCREHQCQRVTLLVWDGDSFNVRSDNGRSEKIRIENIDAPEIEGRCAEERLAALRAKLELVQLLQGRKIKLKRGRLDRYGRQLATVTADERNVGEALIERHAVRRWDGRRTSWCGM